MQIHNTTWLGLQLELSLVGQRKTTDQIGLQNWQLPTWERQPNLHLTTELELQSN